MSATTSPSWLMYPATVAGLLLISICTNLSIITGHHATVSRVSGDMTLLYYIQGRASEPYLGCLRTILLKRLNLIPFGVKDRKLELFRTYLTTPLHFHFSVYLNVVTIITV